jgi:hypothetical protein
VLETYTTSIPPTQPEERTYTNKIKKKGLKGLLGRKEIEKVVYLNGPTYTPEAWRHHQFWVDVDEGRIVPIVPRTFKLI